MQIPFLVLSYGDFKSNHKLFSYERDGVHTMPVFTDASRAVKFAKVMSRTLCEHFGDNRTLTTQLCTDPKMALDMFQTIAAHCPDLIRIVLDPFPPIRDDSEFAHASNMAWIENFQDIDDVLEQLQDWVVVDSGIVDESESNGV